VTRKIRDGKRYGERQYYIFVGGPPQPPAAAEPPPGLRWKQADTLVRELAQAHGVAGIYTTERAQWDRTIHSPFYKLDPPWPGWRWFCVRTHRRPDYLDGTGWYDGMLPGAAPAPSSRAAHKPANFFSPKSPAAAKRLYEQNYARNKGKKRPKKKPATLTPPQVEAHTPAPSEAAPRAVPPIKRPRPTP